MPGPTGLAAAATAILSHGSACISLEITPKIYLRCLLSNRLALFPGFAEIWRIGHFCPQFGSVIGRRGMHQAKTGPAGYFAAVFRCIFRKRGIASQGNIYKLPTQRAERPNDRTSEISRRALFTKCTVLLMKNLILLLPPPRQGRSAQRVFVVLAGLLSHPGFHSCLKPEINIFVECDLCALQVAAQVAFAQSPGQVCLRFPRGTVDGSIVVFAFVSLVIAGQINPDEPSAVAPCDDLANFVGYRNFLLGPQKRAHLPYTA